MISNDVSRDIVEEKVEVVEGDEGEAACGKWGSLPMELLVEVMRRVEMREKAWPGRIQLLWCAAVCSSWRAATIEVMRTVEQSGIISFPVSLKQPGPRVSPVQCFIRRERASSTYYLYLGQTPALLGESGKFLLAARKIRHASSTNFNISLASDDFSRASNMYVGKVRSNFLGTKFTIYDGQPHLYIPIPSRNSSSRRIHSKQVSPRVSAANYAVATVTYEVTVLRSRGPRKMHCSMHSIPISSLREGGKAPTPTILLHDSDEQLYPMTSPKNKSPISRIWSKSSLGTPSTSTPQFEPLVMKNKTPRWHEQLQCWCLNFRGRVTVASVKNFQLVADVDPSQQGTTSEIDNVIVQFGKIGKDIFTMDYMYPLSAFQAFAICLSSFDTKPVCE